MTNTEIKDMIVKYVEKGEGDVKDIINNLKITLVDSDGELDIDNCSKFRDDTGLTFVYKEAQDLAGKIVVIGVKYHETAFEFAQVK